MKKFFGEFKEFINRGNVMDLAVAVIIGGAFTAIINSLVNDLITPILSLLTGGIQFESLSVALGVGENAATLNYGLLIAAVINFLLVALVIFFMIKGINKVMRRNTDNTPTTKKCPYCKSEIPLSAVRCPQCTTILDLGAIPEDLR